MTFSYAGKKYAIEFRRKHEYVDVHEGLAGMTVRKLSKFPFTTASIVEVVEGKNGEEFPVVAKGTVGCAPEDNFTLESGRLKALKKLTPDLPIGMRKLVWESYHARKDKKVSPDTPTPASQGQSVQVPEVLLAPIPFPASVWVM